MSLEEDTRGGVWTVKGRWVSKSLFVGRCWLRRGCADPEIFAGIGGVVNVGGLSNDPTAEYNPGGNYEMSTLATRALARSCKERGSARCVFTSSCSIYHGGVGDEEKGVCLAS